MEPRSTISHDLYGGEGIFPPDPTVYTGSGPRYWPYSPRSAADPMIPPTPYSFYQRQSVLARPTPPMMMRFRFQHTGAAAYTPRAPSTSTMSGPRGRPYAPLRGVPRASFVSTPQQTEEDKARIKSLVKQFLAQKRHYEQVHDDVAPEEGNAVSPTETTAIGQRANGVQSTETTTFEQKPNGVPSTVATTSGQKVNGVPSTVATTIEQNVNGVSSMEATTFGQKANGAITFENKSNGVPSIEVTASDQQADAAPSTEQTSIAQEVNNGQLTELSNSGQEDDNNSLTEKVIINPKIVDICLSNENMNFGQSSEDSEADSQEEERPTRAEKQASGKQRQTVRSTPYTLRSEYKSKKAN